MSSLSGRRLISLLACLPLLLAGCHKKTTESGPQYIMLTFNNAACEQNGSTDIIEISPNQPVVYQGAAMLRQFEVRFAAACPFASCPVSSPHGTSMNIGSPNAGTAGSTFNYSGMTINNESCRNGATLGVHIKEER